MWVYLKERFYPRKEGIYRIECDLSPTGRKGEEGSFFLSL